MSKILLVPVPPADHNLIVFLQARLASVFRTAVELYPKRDFSPSCAFDFGRNQFNSTVLLGAALERFNGTYGKILCVTALDLFVPVLTYVFGEAQLDGTAAIVSTHRLDETLYGLPKNQVLLEERLLKEAIHELGHTFGLLHCHDFNCVMHSSTSVEEIDVKGVIFCTVCKERLLQLPAGRA
ncbi:MAG TPA: archaemetzincin family Zn-dependent metalloprotease [Bacteroidota bacterium]|nr:archaemetzincin family Zn-dependent metalloprotease [Bacteroidota bacterium]